MLIHNFAESKGLFKKFFSVNLYLLSMRIRAEMRNPGTRASSSSNLRTCPIIRFDSDAANNSQVLSDHDGEVALSIGINSAAALIQVIYQRHGLGPHNQLRLSTIFVVVSMFFTLGSRFLSRPSSISAARRCSTVGLFSASLAMASLLAIPFHGILKCIPFAICFFPLVSLLWDLFVSPSQDLEAAGTSNQQQQQQQPSSSRNASSVQNLQMAHVLSTAADAADPRAPDGDVEEASSFAITTSAVDCRFGIFSGGSRKFSEEEEEEEADQEGGSPPTFSNLSAAATVQILNQPSRNATTGAMVHVVDVVAIDEEEESSAADEGHQVGYYDCFFS